MIGCLFCAGTAWGCVTFLTPMPPEQVFVGSCCLYNLFTFSYLEKHQDLLI